MGPDRGPVVVVVAAAVARLLGPWPRVQNVMLYYCSYGCLAHDGPSPKFERFYPELRYQGLVLVLALPAR